MECTCTTSGKTSIIVPQPSQNVLLSLLNPETAERIYPHLHLVPMELGQVLYEPGDTMKNVFFPIDCIVSLLYVMESGASAEISVVRNYGQPVPAFTENAHQALGVADIDVVVLAHGMSQEQVAAKHWHVGEMLALLVGDPLLHARKQQLIAFGVQRVVHRSFAVAVGPQHMPAGHGRRRVFYITRISWQHMVVNSVQGFAPSASCCGCIALIVEGVIIGAGIGYRDA